MSKLSKKKRKLLTQREIEKKRRCKSVNIRVDQLYDGQPLSGMRIKKVNRYEPISIDSEFVTPAFENRLREKFSQIVFKPQAVRHLFSYIGWGETKSYNVIEQQGILVGQVYKTPSGYTGMVEDVLLSEAIGNSVYVESAHSQWYEMDKKLDELNEGRNRKLVKVGWWHTHPNMNVFMSGTDKDTQKFYFHKEWQFAVVLNPQERKWAVFIGEDAQPCYGFFINNNMFRLKLLGGNKDE